MRVFYAPPDSFLIVMVPDPRNLIREYDPDGRVYVYRGPETGIQRLNVKTKEGLKHTLHALGAFNHAKKAIR